VRRLTSLIAISVLALGVYAGFRMHERRSAAASNSSLSVSATPSNASVQAPAEPGLPPAPEITLTDLNGHALEPSNLKGKVVLVNFWAAWCGPCAEEVPQFIALQKKYQDQGLQVIGVSVDDDPEVLRRFYRKYQMNYPVVPGDIKISDAFGGVLGLPTTFVIGRDYRIHGKHAGATDFSMIDQEIAALLLPKS
jgi:thiol-disulfide isomerase/thioredoxin